MIAQIQLAMLARLQAVSNAGALPFAWRTLGTFPTDWEEYLESNAVTACPGAWVVFSGWDRTERYSGENDEPMLRVLNGHFGLMVAAENNRPNEEPQRHGGPDPAKEPGSYLLLEGAVAALAGQFLGDLLDEPLEPGPARAVVPTAGSTKRRMSRLACDFTCSFTLALSEDGELDDFSALHVNWDIPLLGSPDAIDADPVAPGVQLPDDFRADAVDHITLPGDA